MPVLLKFLGRLLVFVAVISIGVIGWEYVPDRHDPFAPLDLDEQPGLAFPVKLARLKASPEACLAAIEASGMTATPLPDRTRSENCGLTNAVNIVRSTTPYSAPVNATCQIAASLYLWERLVVIPAAEEFLGSPPSRIETFGTYSCRRVNGSESGRWSQHATANAIDIAGFELADGRYVGVQADWRPPEAGSDESLFLTEVRNGACRFFSTVLSPDYNAAHADHFHLDQGGFSICR